MPRFLKKSKKDSDSVPGTLLLVGEKKAETPILSPIDYSDQEIIEREAVSQIELSPYRDSSSTSWVNIDGIHDLSLLKDIGDLFDIHPLT